MKKLNSYALMDFVPLEKNVMVADILITPEYGYLHDHYDSYSDLQYYSGFEI